MSDTTRAPYTSGREIAPEVVQSANWPAGFPDEPATWSGSVYFRLQYPKRFAHGVVADKEVR